MTLTNVESSARIPVGLLVHSLLPQPPGLKSDPIIFHTNENALQCGYFSINTDKNICHALFFDAPIFGTVGWHSLCFIREYFQTAPIGWDVHG